MNKIIKPVFLLAIFVFVTSLTSPVSSQQNNSNQNIPDTSSKPPAFKDGGKAAERLKTVYECEGIEFENWGDHDAADSTLTVCLINSKRVPTGGVEDIMKRLKAIARQMKSAVKYPANYKSYYIIFVKRETHFGETMRSHTQGADIASKDL